MNESLSISIIQPSLNPFNKYKNGSHNNIEDVLVEGWDCVLIDSMAEICAPEQSDIQEDQLNKNRKLVYTVDMIGRESYNKNQLQPLIYFFDDGSYEKRFYIFNGSTK